MHIGVNAYRLQGSRHGVGRYIEYMVRYWDSMLTEHDRQTVFLREPLGKYAYPLSSKTRFVVLKPRLTSLLWENAVLPLQSSKIDVLFCPSYTAPLLYPGKRVVAIHSLNEIKDGAHAWWYPLTWGLRYRLSAQHADIVAVPSESTRQDVIAHYRISPSKVVVAPQGSDDCFQPINDAALIAATRSAFFPDGRPYVLWVGTMSQRRNIPQLIRAFAQLKRETDLPHGLVLLGANPLDIPIKQLCDELSISDSVVHSNPSFVDHAEIVPIYCAADLFVSASLYEGFSLTLCESMACGTPVIATNTGGAAEIVGDAGLLLDDPAPDHLAKGMREILSAAELRNKLREKALQRAKLFHYENTAAITLQALRSIAST